MSAESKSVDCVICGSCTADILVHPFDLSQPVGVGQLHRVDPIGLCVGGMVSNAAITLARLGLQTAAFSATGQDRWGKLVRAEYAAEGVDTDYLIDHPELPTSTTVVMINEAGERSFVHSQGAPKAMNRDDYMNAMPLFASSRAMLLGYYPLLPKLIDDLVDVFREIRTTGCMTAIDAAGGGGTMDPLADLLPHLDVYCPSHDEARNQTGKEDPTEILKLYRECGAPGLLGVKLGNEGAMLSPKANEFVPIQPAEPPGTVVDTTGAGDVFYAALMAAILKGKDPKSAGEFAARAGAISVTKPGATNAVVAW